jgi:hypothetical protein
MHGHEKWRRDPIREINCITPPFAGHQPSHVGITLKKCRAIVRNAACDLLHLGMGWQFHAPPLAVLSCLFVGKEVGHYVVADTIGGLHWIMTTFAEAVAATTLAAASFHTFTNTTRICSSLIHRETR